MSNARPDAVAGFLHFGYLPRLDSAFNSKLVEAASAGGGDSLEELGFEELVRLGTRAIRSGYGDLDGELHVVPLSGGLDSRAILAALVESGARDRVVTVTMGTPGTFDYDIARRVARVAGVRHEEIDLRQVELGPPALESALLASGAASWGFDALFHRQIPSRFGPGATYWSGFMAGTLAGARLPNPVGGAWEAAIAQFSAQSRFSRSIAPAPGCDPAALLPTRPCLDQRQLSYHDQIDFGVRQSGCIAPTVLVEGHDYRCPLMHPGWLGFILNVPLAMREQERLYRAILTSAFPALFRLATKNSFGLPLRAPEWMVTARRRLAKGVAAARSRSVGAVLRRGPFPAPLRMVNYIDFAGGLQRRKDLRELVHDTVRALDQRGVAPWIDATGLWRRQERSPGDPDLASALTLLASLELNLRVEGRRPGPLFNG